MIDAEFTRTMARYNAWQNESLCTAAARLADTDREADRGAFFGSIRATLSHILWADHVWMSRLADWPRPDTGLRDSPRLVTDWDALVAARRKADAGIRAWADELSDVALTGDLTWWSGAAEREVVKPRALCVVHMFNHQTHHRGQVHAMLTAAGARPDATDLFMMPADT